MEPTFKIPNSKSSIKDLSRFLLLYSAFLLQEILGVHVQLSK